MEVLILNLNLNIRLTARILIFRMKCVPISLISCLNRKFGIVLLVSVINRTSIRGGLLRA